MKGEDMKKGIKQLAVFAILGVLSLSFPLTALALEGWNQQNGQWTYVERSGRLASKTFKMSKGFWYYLAEDGHMLKNCLFRVGNTAYCAGEDGKLRSNTWIYANSSVDQKDEFEEGWYYFGADLKGYRRRDNSFRKNINGKTYIFNEDGLMLTGWFDEGGNSLNDTVDPFVNALYYSRADGALLSEAWLDYGEIGDSTGGSAYESVVANRNYAEYEKLWLYFGKDCRKLRSKGEKLYPAVIGGATYGFDENGIMLPWWSKVNVDPGTATDSDADRSNPTSDTSAKYFSGYDGGFLMKNTWLWMYPSENLDPDDFNGQESAWWRTNNKGEVFRNKIVNVGGRTYAFDGLGRMRSGLILFDGKSVFVAQYAPDAWSSQDFIDGNIYGVERADLYLFSPDELNDGSMQVGKEVQIELSDGVFTFGFAQNGKAYGNRNKLKRVGDSFYINGLKLKAEEGTGYGVVEVNQGSDFSYYQVVDEAGKIMTGGKTALKDEDGGYLIIVNSKFVAYAADAYKPKWRNGDYGTGFYHYDKDNKLDPYAEGLIAGYGSFPDPGELPPAQRLNFN